MSGDDKHKWINLQWGKKYCRW